MSDATKQEIRELAEAAAGIRRYAVGDYFGSRAYAAAVERYERALLQPGVVATLYGEARPAVEHPLRAAGRDLFHAVAALDRMFETDSEMTHEQRVAVYRQAYLAQEAWLALDPEAQTAPPAQPVEDPRDARINELLAAKALAEQLRDDTIRDGLDLVKQIRDLRALLGRCATAARLFERDDEADNHPPVGYRLRIDLDTLTALRDMAADLRAAGVEPTPGATPATCNGFFMHPPFTTCSVHGANTSPVEAAHEGKASRHGETCQKAPHVGTGYLHDESADGPYDVDGLTYCGRCHGSMD